MHNAESGAPKQTLFYVFSGGQQSGPFSVAEIAERVRSHNLELNDYLYDESAADWIFLAAHEGLSKLVSVVSGKDQVATSPQPQGAEAASEENSALSEWFALRGELRFGPFAFLELIRLLQEKQLHDSDYVWHKGLKNWQIISSLPEFSPDSIRSLRESGLAKLDEVFFRRRHARVPHDCSVLMHNNRSVYRGRGLEISAGGAGVVLETPALVVGHQIFLHFKPGTEIPSFNAVCEIVSRRPVNSADASAPTHYGVKFLKIESQTTQAIEAFATRHSVQKAG